MFSIQNKTTTNKQQEEQQNTLVLRLQIVQQSTEKSILLSQWQAKQKMVQMEISGTILLL